MLHLHVAEARDRDGMMASGKDRRGYEHESSSDTDNPDSDDRRPRPYRNRFGWVCAACPCSFNCAHMSDVFVCVRVLWCVYMEVGRMCFRVNFYEFA